MNDIIKIYDEEMSGVIDTLNNRLTQVRAGRANPSMLDSVMCNYYGSQTPVKGMATINVSDARTLMIKPFDKTSIGIIEKAIFEANLGLTPSNNGETIIITLPILTEERRVEFVKQSKSMCEDAKVGIRKVRQDALTEIKKEEISDDEKKNLETKVQDLVNKYNKNIDQILKDKETELMSV